MVLPETDKTEMDEPELDNLVFRLIFPLSC